MCPHTAIGYLGLQKYREHHRSPGIILSTAHPAKFKDSLDQILSNPIALPEALTSLMHRSKKFDLIENQYKDLKDFLLK